MSTLKYDEITKAFQRALGNRFILDYNNNLDENWKDNLHEDEFVHCVLRLDSGRTQYIGDTTLKIETMHIEFAIPKVKDIFEEAIGKIEEVRTVLNNNLIQIGESDFCKILMQQRTDGIIERVNAVDWIFTDLYFETQEFHSLFTSDDRKIKIDNVELKGILRAVYDLNKSVDSYCKGSNTQATNKINSIQKQLTIDLVPSDDNTALATIHNEEDLDKTYSITYIDGYKTRTFNALMVHLTEESLTGDIIKNQITFVKTN